MLERWQAVFLEVLKSSWASAVAVPFVLAYALGVAKAASRRGGPNPLTFIFRPSRTQYADRALGLDLLFAAAASQLSYLAAYATGLIKPTLISGLAPKLLAALNITVADKVALSFDLLLLILGAVIVIAAATRFGGYKRGSDELREVFVTGPNLLGLLVLLAVWGVNTQ